MDKIKSGLSGNLFPALVFTGFFLLLFIQFPLSGSLPGSTDNWWYLGVFNELQNNIYSFFTGKEWGNSLYPETGMYAFGEPSFGSAAIFLPFKWIGFNDIWAYYIFHCLLFAANAFGTFLLSSHFLEKKSTQYFSAFMFSCSALMFGMMDDQKVISWAPALLGIHFLFQFAKHKVQKYLLLAAFFLGITVWFSGYVFFFTMMALGIFGIVHLKKWAADWKKMVFPFLLLLILVIPFILMFPLNPRLNGAVSLIDLFRDFRALCLQPGDLLQTLPNNFIYKSGFSENPSFVFTWHCAWQGILSWILFLSGLFSSLKFKRELLLLFLIFLLLSIGPFVKIGDSDWYAPFYPLFKFFPGFSFIRIPIRAFQVCLIILVIFAGKGLETWIIILKKEWIVSLCCISVFLLENTPIPFQTYSSHKYLSPEKAFIEWANGKRNSVCLMLPSGLTDKHFHYGLSVSAREEIYMYWQTQTGINLVNGTGYLPRWRWENQQWIDSISVSGNLDKLITANKLDYIIWFPGMQLADDPVLTSSVLANSANLEKELSGQNFSVYRVRKSSEN